MKKRPQNFSQDFKMPHLFREDLEDIENIIKDLSPREFKFETKDFEYNSIQEISKDFMVVNDFHVQTQSPYISIDFRGSSARIYSGDDDIKTIGVVKKIADIISKRERVFLWYLSNSAPFIVPALFFSFILLLASTVHKEVKPSVVWYIIVSTAFLLSGLWGVIGIRSTLKNFSLIEFVYRKNKPSFFLRNKDQIIVGIIVAIISVVATLFFSKII